MARKQRAGPAHADDEPDRSETRTPRRRRERDPEREGKERDQEHAVHARMRARVERHLHVVEVEEAAPEAREDPAGEAPAEGELERARGGDSATATRRRAPGTSAGRSASATTSAACAELVPFSSRSQLQASRVDASAPTTSVLGTSRLPDLRRAQPFSQVVAAAQNDRGHPGRLEPEQLRDPLARSAAEARRVDQDERDRAAP